VGQGLIHPTWLVLAPEHGPHSVHPLGPGVVARSLAPAGSLLPSWSLSRIGLPSLRPRKIAAGSADVRATTLLRLSPSAIERAGRHRSASVRSVAGLAQAVALEYGKGRVVVLGEADVATSQIVGPPGAHPRMGLQWPGSDNERFVVNALLWLTLVL
jgi:2-polyprenyl-6-methoxyphenol hydroxylase-like FAD-dependent oxidoreductase